MRYIFVLIVALFLSSALSAQVRANVNFNLDTQPIWGPTGHDYVENYYMPDIEVYYNVPQHRYYYNQGGRWVSSSRLPSRYRNYDLYNARKEVVNDPQPWRNHETYKDKFAADKDRHDEQPIRDSRDAKYFVNKNHPEHNNWVKQQQHDNDKYSGWNKGNNGQGRIEDKKQRNEQDRQDNGNNK